MEGRHRLKPYSLPDAGRSWIPDGVRLQLPILLSARLREIRRIVFRSYDYFLRPGFSKEVGNVGVKGSVATLVLTDWNSAHPDLGAVIDRSEVKQEALPSRQIAQIEISAVPHSAVQPIRVNPAGKGFRAKRNCNFSR